MELSQSTLNALRFETIREALTARCRTDVGRERASRRPFLDNAEEVKAALKRVDEARQLKAEPLSLPISGVSDVRQSVDRAAKSGMLEPRELIAITHALFAFNRISELLEERRSRLPGLASLGMQLPVFEKLAMRLERSFEASGEISDRASVDLRDARDHARSLHRTIKGRLDRMLHDEKFSSNLREGYYSVRNDRYVVPVTSQARNEIPGIVHNASQSGQTLFVEPTELIGLGNDLAIAQSVVLEEERKVLIELSGQVGREASSINRGVDAVAELDEAEAAALLSNDLKANEPLLEKPDGALELKGLRHPRLAMQQGADVIANDVDLRDARALVISGPNAGGKTVTLSGVGLCALMARVGLPIPADPGSRLPLFNQVHSAVGDAQDLNAGLSTFSAHVSMLRDICQVAKRGALVLIDEIAADTDPREGAAIAVAVLEELLERGALVLVTTHLEELKALAHLDPRFVNAKVGFDSRKMAPTYKLQMGAAGASSAIDIARRVGLPESICMRATDLAQNSGGALSKALAAAEDERRKLWEARDAADSASKEAAKLKEQVEAEHARQLKGRKEEELKFREALRAELEFARAQIRTLVEKLEAQGSAKAAAQASAELTARLNEQTQSERAARAELKGEKPPSGPVELKAGGKARHLGLDAEVEILEVDGNQVLVAMGALKMRVAPNELGPSASKAKEPARFPSKDKKDLQLQKAEQSAAKPLTLASPTLDLRGERADDAIRQLEQFLDRLSRSGDAAAIVIHGHGTGALKAGIREYLGSSGYASSHRPGEAHEGGDGVTVVMLA